MDTRDDIGADFEAEYRFRWDYPICDTGMTWRCYGFDTSFWSIGFTLGLESDLGMYASTATYSDPHVRPPPQSRQAL